MKEVIDILLVEDDPNDRDLTLHILQRENLANRIHVARDGEEALDFLFSRGSFADRSVEHPPRLVLLDLKLGRESGLDLLAELQRVAPGLGVVSRP